MIKKKRLLCKSRRCDLCGEAEIARSLPTAQLQKTQGISHVAEQPLFGLVQSDTAATRNTQAHMGPTPRRIVARRANAEAAWMLPSGTQPTPAVDFTSSRSIRACSSGTCARRIVRSRRGNSAVGNGQFDDRLILQHRNDTGKRFDEGTGDEPQDRYVVSVCYAFAVIYWS